MSTVYRVTHRTEYVYEQEVTASYGQLHLLPRELPGQRCTSSRLTVDPRPESLRERSTSSATASASSRCTCRTRA